MLDSEIPTEFLSQIKPSRPGSGVTVKNIVNSGSALERLKKLIPPCVQPKFTSAAELLAWQREEGLKHCEELSKRNQKARTEKIFGRSGIQSLYRSRTFANYEVSGEQQRKAYTMAKSYAQNFGAGFASFVFSGGHGTGKTIWQQRSEIISCPVANQCWW